MRNRKHDIERYLRGELSPAEMHALEKEALNDPFLAEALEGVEQAGADNFLYDLHTIRRSVRESARRRSRKEKKPIRMWGWTSAIAASVLLIAVSGFLVITLLKQQAAREQAMQTAPDPLLESRTPKDTLIIILPTETSVTKKHHVPRSSADIPQPSVTPSETSDDSARETDFENDQDLVNVADIPESGQTENDKAIDVVKDDPVAIASEEEVLTNKNKSAEVQGADVSVSKALQGRVAGVESRRQPISAVDSEASVFLKGRVVSEEGEALPGVNVMARGTNIGTVTDVDGKYELLLPESNRNVIFSFIGFASQEVAIGDKAELDVTLKADASSLSEVVVTGYAAEKKNDHSSTFHFAEPAGGRTDYNEYLSKSVKYPEEALKTRTHGRVTVRFTVEPDGTLGEFEVIKGIGAGCEEELIRAIKAGPAWQPSSRGDVPLRDQVKVRYRFVLPE